MLRKIKVDLEKDTFKKDWWDKLNILAIAFVPIVVGISANKIAVSISKQELATNLIAYLQNDDYRRDIALITLNKLVPVEKKRMLWIIPSFVNDPDNDQVYEIALFLFENLMEEALEETQSTETKKKLMKIRFTKKVIIERSSLRRYCEEIYSFLKRNQEENTYYTITLVKEIVASECDQNDFPDPVTTDSNFPTGIRIVYIHYKENQDSAEKLRDYLQRNDVITPEIDPVSGVTQNDIRYANSKELSSARKLMNNLNQQKDLNLEFSEENLRDLSKLGPGYKVKSGQFEIWLKD